MTVKLTGSNLPSADTLNARCNLYSNSRLQKNVAIGRTEPMNLNCNSELEAYHICHAITLIIFNQEKHNNIEVQRRRFYRELNLKLHSTFKQ